MGAKIPSHLRKQADKLAHQYVFFAIIRSVIYEQGAKEYHDIEPGEIYHFNTDKAVKSRAGKLVYDEWRKAADSSNAAIHRIKAIEAKQPPVGDYFDSMVDKWNSFFETEMGKNELRRYLSNARFQIASTEFHTRPLRADEARVRLLKAIPHSSQREANALWQAIETLHSGITKRWASQPGKAASKPASRARSRAKRRRF